MAYSRQPTTLAEELSRNTERSSRVEIFENPIYESTPFTGERLRHVTEFLAGRLPRDDPVYRPENQRIVLQRLFEEKLDNAERQRKRYNIYKDHRVHQPLVIPRPSLGDIHGQPSVKSPGPSYGPATCSYSRHQYVPLSHSQPYAAHPQGQFYAEGMSSKTANAQTCLGYDVPQAPRSVGTTQQDIHNATANHLRGGTTIIQNQELRKGVTSKKVQGSLPVSVGGAPFTTFVDMSKELKKYPVRKDVKKKKKKSDLVYGAGRGAADINSSSYAKDVAVRKEDNKESHLVPQPSRATGHLQHLRSANAAPRQNQHQLQPKYLNYVHQPPDGRSDAPVSHDYHQR